VLCDTLLESFTEDEIEVVMGHELGHHKLKHILKEMLLGGIFTLLTLFITNMLFLKLHPVFDLALLYDFDALILVYAIISIINIPILVLNNAYSRKLEKQADRFALELTNKKAAFISTMKKLAEQNLADLTPGKFYKIILYSHPPISERIAFGESFKGIPKKDR
ncbi:MAG: M48 family metalloprotease, partial [Candidatus Omnitrophota bacterium]|jgi:STE24 endopeptidase|nr:M48 family metalloprotease [Candidatus Omnitrophota bacterium]